MEHLDEEVIGVVRARQAKRKTRILGKAFLVHPRHVEGRIGHDEVKPACLRHIGEKIAVGVVEAVGVADVARQAMSRKVHLVEVDRDAVLLDAIDDHTAFFLLIGFLRPCGELCRVDEHAAGAAGRVEDAPLERLDDLDDQVHNAFRREEDAALLPLGHRELAEEIFVHLAEGIARELHRGERAHHLDQHVIGNVGEGARESPRQVFILFLNRTHGVVEILAEIGIFRQVRQELPARRAREINRLTRLVVFLGDNPPPARTDRADLVLQCSKQLLGIAKEDEAKHRHGELRGTQPRIGPEVVGYFPQSRPNFCVHHALKSPLNMTP